MRRKKGREAIMTLERIAPRILRVPPVKEPLSSDSFIIEGDARYYVYDVGASDAACTAIAALDKPVTVILSHFHRDHTANMTRLSPDEILVGARTRRQLGLGTLVDAPLHICDGVELLIQPCVSPHAPGCLIVTVDGLHTLIGDLHYARPEKGQGEAKGMWNQLKALQTEYFILSHSEGDPVVPKMKLLRDVEAYFGIQ